MLVAGAFSRRKRGNSYIIYTHILSLFVLICNTAVRYTIDCSSRLLNCLEEVSWIEIAPSRGREHVPRVPRGSEAQHAVADEEAAL